MKRGLGAGGSGLVVLAACMMLPAALPAQDKRLQFTVAGLAGQEIVQSHVDQVNDRFTGLILGAEGVLMSDRLMVRVRYGEGRIKPSSGSADPREVVEGEALFGVRAAPWLSIWAGPSARAYTMGDSDQRWLVWTARATGRGILIPGHMQTFVELWGALSGNVGNPGIKAGGRGANGGLEVRLGDANFWGRLGYRIESTHAETLRETVETVTLSLIYGLPQ
ncbi:MAG: hypothetical protein ACREMI_04070 [Gemmatimonadales bacterium]